MVLPQRAVTPSENSASGYARASASICRTVRSDRPPSAGSSPRTNRKSRTPYAAAVRRSRRKPSRLRSRLLTHATARPPRSATSRATAMLDTVARPMWLSRDEEQVGDAVERHDLAAHPAKVRGRGRFDLAQNRETVRVTCHGFSIPDARSLGALAVPTHGGRATARQRREPPSGSPRAAMITCHPGTRSADARAEELCRGGAARRVRPRAARRGSQLARVGSE